MSLIMTATATALSALTIYVYPSHRPLDWSSPQQLARGLVKTGVYSSMKSPESVTYTDGFGEQREMTVPAASMMGHAMAHIQCRLSDGEKWDHWSSLTGQNSHELDRENLLKKKIGFGMLLYNYPDGRIINGIENPLRLIYVQSKQGGPRYLRFKITTQACDRLRKMMEFFESLRFDVLYFNTADPYEAYHARLRGGQNPVGGGCSSYAAALLKEAGVFRPAFQDLWQRKIRISQKLIGTAEQKVSVWDILTGSLGRSWSHDGAKDVTLALYDPNLIWQFVKDLEKKSSYRSEVQTFSHTRQVQDLKNKNHYPPPVEDKTTAVKISGITFE